MNDTSNLITPGIKFTCENGKQYETTGEFRPPKCFEAYLGRNSLACRSSHNWNASAIILRELPPPAPPRRVPTDQDALHRPKCWVRDSDPDEWSGSMRLVAVLNSDIHSLPFSVTNSGACSGGCWRFCEIEDVPLGPVYHWRDATEAVAGTIPECIQYANDIRGFGIVARNFIKGTRVLVEVGK